MKRLSRLFVLLSLAAGPSAEGRVVYVSQNAPGPVFDGASWSTALPTVSEGLAAAASGDEVWVARGTYQDYVDMGDGIALYGGFAGGETERAQRDWGANRTVICGPGTWQATVICWGDNVVVDGFTLGRPGGFPGTVYCIQVAGGSATISHNTISGDGIGLFVDIGTAAVADNVILGNKSGGVSVAGAATLTNNTVAENGAFGVMVSGPATLANNAVSGNAGSGVIVAGTAHLVNNTVHGNTEDGVTLRSGTAALQNNIIASNGRCGVANADGAVSACSHNDVFGNAGGAYSNYSPPADQGNITADPRLSIRDLDVHIFPDSPCVDAGDDAAVIGATDLDGQPRLQGKHVDIGSDENNGTVIGVPQTIWHVSPAGSDANDGLTWTTARRTVKAALAGAVKPDEVWVARGTYLESLTPPAGVALYGGFGGTEAQRSQRDWRANPTVVDGRAIPGATAAIVAQARGLVVDGFTLPSRFSVVSGTATLSNCTISGTAAGVEVEAGRATIAGNTICGSAYEGVFVAGTAVLTGNTIASNGFNGVLVYGGAATLVNNTITANGRSGVSVESGTASLANNILAFNSEHGLAKGGGTVSAFTHNDVYGNEAGANGAYTPPSGQGNIALDPKLSSPYRDIHLQPGSPCLDAGEDSVAGGADIDGQPRVQGSHVDIGSDEGDGTAWTVPSTVWYVSATGDDASDGRSWASARRTLQGALAGARGPDEVWVGAGSYTANVTPPAGVGLYGGFAGTETQRSQRNWVTSPSRLSADPSSGGGAVTCRYAGVVADGITFDGTEGIVSISGSARIANNTISVGGCAIQVYGGRPAIAGNTISACGTGVRVDGGEPTIEGNAITGSTGESLGIYGGARASVLRNTISRNARGVLLSGDGPRVFEGNTIAANGTTGASVEGLCTATITGNTLVANADSGLSVTDTSKAAVSNNIIAFNSGYGVRAASISITAFSHNDLFGNASGESIPYAVPADQGNIRLDPGLSSTYRRIHIQPTSPCINAGDDAAAAASTDIDGEARVQGAHVDIGSDESNGTVWPDLSAIWYVSPTGNDANDGRTWATAKRTIRAALGAATELDEVWVARGTYGESVTIPDSVGLYGGFAGTETQRSQRDLKANATVLDLSGAPANLVTCTSRSVVDGFTLERGSTGVVASSGMPTIFNNIVSHNRYGVYAASPAVTLTGNTVIANEYSGVCIAGGPATLTNNTICGNGQEGVRVSSSATLTNNIIAFNSGYGVFTSSGSTYVFSHNDVYGNGLGHDYSGPPPSGGGNISADPLFVSRATDDYRPKPGSPCIDAGDDSVAPPGATDGEGKPRLLGLHVDIGAIEFDPVPLSLPDVFRALSLAAGLTEATPADIARLDAAPPTGVDLLDAVRIAGLAAK